MLVRIPKNFSCVSCVSQRRILYTQCVCQRIFLFPRTVVPATVQLYTKVWGAETFPTRKSPPPPAPCVPASRGSVWPGWGCWQFACLLPVFLAGPDEASVVTHTDPSTSLMPRKEDHSALYTTCHTTETVTERLPVTQFLLFAAGRGTLRQPLCCRGCAAARARVCDRAPERKR